MDAQHSSIAVHFSGHTAIMPCAPLPGPVKIRRPVQSKVDPLNEKVVRQILAKKKAFFADLHKAG